MSQGAEVLAVGRFVVLAKAEGAEPLSARDLLGPRCYTAGAGRVLLGLMPDSDSAQVWFLEWANGLVAAACLPVGQAPDPQMVHDASADLLPEKFSLRTVQPANELAC